MLVRAWSSAETLVTDSVQVRAVYTVAAALTKTTGADSSVVPYIPPITTPANGVCLVKGYGANYCVAISTSVTGTDTAPSPHKWDVLSLLPL